MEAQIACVAELGFLAFGGFFFLVFFCSQAEMQRTYERFMDASACHKEGVGAETLHMQSFLKACL